MKIRIPHSGKVLIALVLTVALLAMSACTPVGEEAPRIDSITAELVSGAPGPTATASPAPGQSPSPTAAASPIGEGGSVTVTVRVTNFDIIEPSPSPAGSPAASPTQSPTSTATTSEGYLIYYLDRIPDAATNLILPITPTQTMGQRISSGETSITWSNLTPGIHVFVVQLVDRNGEPLDPPVIAGVALTVVQSAASPSPTETASPTGTP